MNAPIRFLHAFSQALSTMMLYTPGHSGRTTAARTAYELLRSLLERGATAVFSFSRGAPRFGPLPLPQLEGWRWSERLAGIGLERVEFHPPVTWEEFERFLDLVVLHLGTGPKPAGAEAPPLGDIRGAGITVQVASPAEASPNGAPLEDLDLGLLDGEIESMRWILEQVMAGRVPLLEVEALVTALAVAVTVERPLLVPLVHAASLEHYPAIHAVNVALLALRYGEQQGLGESDLRELGTAALLHDVGMLRLPTQLLQQAGLSPIKRRLVESHVVLGTRMLLEAGPAMELSAVVAYEHHLRPDGLGYPVLRFPREQHFASRVVAVCSAFDALLAARPYRPAWKPERALNYLEEEAGTVFDLQIARSFAALVRSASVPEAV